MAATTAARPAQLPGCTPAALGSTGSGNIPLPLEADCYTFTGAPGDRIRIRVVETGGILPTLFAQAMVLRPDGSTVCAATQAREFTCTLDAAGTHELVIRDSADAGIGNYSFSIQRLNNPVGCTPLAYGSTVPASISAFAEMDCFTFSGSAGNDVLITTFLTSGTLRPEAEIVRPDGTTVCSRAVTSAFACERTPPAPTPSSCGTTKARSRGTTRCSRRASR